MHFPFHCLWSFLVDNRIVHFPLPFILIITVIFIVSSVSLPRGCYYLYHCHFNCHSNIIIVMTIATATVNACCCHCGRYYDRRHGHISHYHCYHHYLYHPCQSVTVNLMLSISLALPSLSWQKNYTIKSILTSVQHYRFLFRRTLQRRHRHRHPIDREMEGGDRGVRGTLPIVLVVIKPCDVAATIPLLPTAAATATDLAQNQETAMNVTIITEDALIVAQTFMVATDVHAILDLGVILTTGKSVSVSICFLVQHLHISNAWCASVFFFS